MSRNLCSTLEFPRFGPCLTDWGHSAESAGNLFYEVFKSQNFWLGRPFFGRKLWGSKVEMIQIGDKMIEIYYLKWLWIRYPVAAADSAAVLFPDDLRRFL